MAYQGMDVDAVEQASRDLKGHAQQLDQAIAQIDRVVKNLPSVWEGTDAQTFVRTSWPQHRRTLQAVRESIEGLGQSAWNNAQAQRGTSDALTADAPPGGGVSTPLHNASGGGPGDVIRAGLDAAGTVADGFTGVRIGPAGARDITSLLAGSATLAGVPGLGFVEKVGNLLDGVTIADKIAQGDPSFLIDAAHVGADAAEALPNPVAKLSGLATNVIADGIDVATHTDFSADSWRQANAWAVQHPLDAIDGIVDAEMEYLPKLADHFLSLFK